MSNDNPLPPYKSELVTLARNLKQIEQTGTAPINLVFYTKQGLIKQHNHYYTDAHGQQQRLKTTLSLTAKGKQMLIALGHYLPSA